MRRLFQQSVVLFAITASAQAGEVASPCAHYPGHATFETRIGSERDIDEVSLFSPLACSEDALTFTDIRYKTDSNDNREGNLGLGLRFLQENGVAGGYVYFDRRHSSATEKLHTQITAGAEWLTENWELRGNVYMPTTGAKQVAPDGGRVRGEVLSDPFLAGSGIFINVAGQRLITENPLWGGDAEAGFKLPGVDFWLHAGAFAFNAEDTPGLVGARTRATWNVTDNIALTAEGQYDGERGRQGWLGARWNVPFGGPAVKPEGLKTRMSASPVRDIDIVTAAEQQTTPTRNLAVTNAETGQVQRVLYVDNTAAPGGTGTKEDPFDTLAAAQGVLQDYDVIYVNHGDGTTTGMDQGLSITNDGVQLIGSGVDFVYYNDRFRSTALGSFSGKILESASLAPVITNINAGSDGILVTGSDVDISGVTVDGASNHGIHVISDRATDLGTLSIHDITATNNAQNGVLVEANNAGSSLTAANLQNITATSNAGRGVYVLANGSGRIGTATLDQITSNSNTGASGIGVEVESTGAGSIITNASLANVSATGNALYGAHVAADTSGQIITTDLQNITTTNNANRGVYVSVQNNGQIGTATLDQIISSGNTGAGGAGVHIQSLGVGSTISNASLANVSATGNDLYGVYVVANVSGQITNADLQNITTTNNADRGVYVSVQNSGQIGTATLDQITSSGNTGSTGRGLEIEADNAGSVITSANLQNITTTNNAERGILVYAHSSGHISTATLSQIISNNNTGASGRGVQIYSNGAGSEITTASITNASMTGNSAQGILVQANSGGHIGTATLDQITGSNSTSATNGRGVQIYATDAGSIITNAHLTNASLTGNASHGAYIVTDTSGQINTVDLQNVSTTNNAGRGVYVLAASGGQISTATLDHITSNSNTGASGRGVQIGSTDAGSAITNASLTNSSVTGNSQQGVYVSADTGGSMSALFQHVTATGNTSNGVFIDDDTVGAFTADLGGGALGSTGNNRISGNTGTDIRVDLDGLQLKAENNWWGNAAGLLAARRTLDAASTIDSAPFLAADPGP